MLLAATAVQAQINIGGSVYGGARQANVGKSTAVNIGADNHDVIINAIYGGNDISGKIGESISETDAIPTCITEAGDNGITDNTGKNINKYSTFVRTNKEASGKHLFIGRVFGGGNGDYIYTKNEEDNTKWDVVVDGNSISKVDKPEVGKSYLELCGGTIVYAYGGGNNVTVKEKVDICIDNSSEVTKKILANPSDESSNLLTSELLAKMELNSVQTNLEGDFLFARVFGGNNKAPMKLQPIWHLKKGSIRDLYSGGNEGDMLFSQGLLLEIEEGSQIKVDNVYGGCRKADVKPQDDHGNDILDLTKIQLMEADGVTINPRYHFPAGLSARVIIRGGDINNVYGGNDITGKITGGNAIGVYTTISGDIYGGGNGSYPYTDNDKLKDLDKLKYGDYYYNPVDVLKLEAADLTTDDGHGGKTFSQLQSVQALNEFRPYAEQVSIRVAGKENKPTVIHGSVYVGGNSATLKNDDPNNARLELKIGSYAIIDNVYLGNNGANMVLHETADDVLQIMASTDKTTDGSKYNSIDLTQVGLFEKYMDGCAMTIQPKIKFDGDDTTDDPSQKYKKYTSSIGSFFCGGNVGSLKKTGKFKMDFNQEVIVYDKLVGGCNAAYVEASRYNAAYNGGVIGDASTAPTGKIGDKLELNFNGVKIQPKRWAVKRDADYEIEKDANGNVTYLLDGGETGNPYLEWNIISATTGKDVAPATTIEEGTEYTSTNADLDRRLKGGNIYGGCYKSGHVNGNVIINVEKSVVDRKGEFAIFDQIKEEDEILYGHDSFTITGRRSGVILDQQGMDILGTSLNLFGGGYGPESEIWGGTTINLKSGYVFQIFGGGEQGAIGKGIWNETDKKFEYTTYDGNYSTCVNLRGADAGTEKSPASDIMAESEFIYGGGFLAPIQGNTRVNLGNGRIFNSFAGSCNADILGHAETYIGLQMNNDGSTTDGFPYVRDHVYGGNDMGGEILGEGNFRDRVSTDILDKVYNPTNTTESVLDANNNPVTIPNPAVLNAAAYVEYIQGHVDYIFGGSYGNINYKDPYFKDYTNTSDGTPKDGFKKPHVISSFVNFKPNGNVNNKVTRVYGGAQGYTQDSHRDKMHDRSYVLVDIKESTKFMETSFFGAGDFSGIGMGVTPESAKTNANGVTAAAVIDLIRGQINNVYGASYNEGITRRTIVNVPAGSTINMYNIFGGGYGLSNELPCDAYEAIVNYGSSNAIVKEGIYGGNNNARRTLYGQVNITSPVYSGGTESAPGKGEHLTKVYGAGKGEYTWSQYTEVNLKDGALVNRVYGGGNAGMVLNEQSVKAYNSYSYETTDENNQTVTVTKSIDKSLGKSFGTDPVYEEDYFENDLVKVNALGKKCNTNVNIYKGAKVVRYAYGAGYGAKAAVSGSTFISLLGGEVGQDIYAAGESGPVEDKFELALDDDNTNDFTATTNAYIAGGTLRKVFGGGWEGHVGKSSWDVSSDGKTAINMVNIPGESNVVVGIRKDQTAANLLAAMNKVIEPGKDPVTSGPLDFYNGIPAVKWNAYAGGEGGSVFGHANLIINNGYIGYEYNASGTDNAETAIDEHYIEKIEDETQTTPNKNLEEYGNAFGAGYDYNSSVDHTKVTLYGGFIRNSVFGGGEIATVGRGATKEGGEANSDRELQGIYMAGSTQVEMFNGHVMHDVFGGGKGVNNLGYGYNNNDKRYTDGYVFGHTEVHIHGGEIGTKEGITEGYGNVFGGGDVGYVYSAGFFSEGTQKKENTHSPNHIYYYSDEITYKCKEAVGTYAVGTTITKEQYDALSAADKDKIEKEYHLTEDCRVVVSPMLQVKEGYTVDYPATGDNKKTYQPYEYVPTEYLNTLPAKVNGNWTGDWEKLVDKDADGTERGVLIHNAVFAGGNVSSNDDKNYANAITVFGNSTATLFDVYHRDFITVGTEHTGGLYGGGNLSVVGGYRELNITNYGTDYYGMSSRISLDDYWNKLSNRERAYFQLEYLCVQDNGTYHVDDKISEEEYNDDAKVPSQYRNETYWQQFGFCSIYAGRLLNTIQRADLCGVYGSRLVLQGAKDRVAEKGEKIDFTINRVGEVSLNIQKSIAGDTEDEKKEHGNYFGIYSNVNYLGNLTSDVKFDDKRKYSEKVDGDEVIRTDTKNYYDFKVEHLTKPDRNRGVSHNQVALASGVHLELTTENSTETVKDYGYITGIVELALINVKKDIEGGGYVYAKNQHGTRSSYDMSIPNVILLDYNKTSEAQGRVEARTYKRYTYTNSETATLDLETSGNFIHRTKRIIDDCYPNNGIYKDGYVKSPAHYWFIKGSVYVYDQIVSAYVGSASSYAKEVQIPLTITAGSQGRLQLLNVQPNLYAYYISNGSELVKIGTQGTDDKVKVNNQNDAYQLNDVITWWDWNQLPSSEQRYFVKETICNIDTCKIDGVDYPRGTYAFLPNDTETKTLIEGFIEAGKVLDKKGKVVESYGDMFNSSNTISHENGYVLTLDMNSPKVWDDYYTPVSGDSRTGKKKKEEYVLLTDDDKEGYREGPTFKMKTSDTDLSGLYGQTHYKEGDIVSGAVKTDYDNTLSGKTFTPATTQAVVEKRAYVALNDYQYSTLSGIAGSGISETTYNNLSDTEKANFKLAMVCTNSLQIGKDKYILLGDLVSALDNDLNQMAADFYTYNNAQPNRDKFANEAAALKYLKEHLSEAWYCTGEGDYGGQYFDANENYGALKSWCTVTGNRDKFEFNYDAFDVLLDSYFSRNEGEKYQYDGKDSEGNDFDTEAEAKTNLPGNYGYSTVVPVEYDAVFNGTTSITYTVGTSSKTINPNDDLATRTISREEYENCVPNDQIHYTAFKVPKEGLSTLYIVNTTFNFAGTPYAKGQDISLKDYTYLVNNGKGGYVDPVNLGTDYSAGSTEDRVFHYCFEDYTPSTSVDGITGAKGSIIDPAKFAQVPNRQKDFAIQGMEPTETTTLYVSRESTVRDVAKEKVITVIYQYTFFEEDEDNTGSYTQTNELHVLNIHLQLESGAPEIGTLSAPPAVLPGNGVGLIAPSVNPGLYEVLTSGWEMYTDMNDAENHRNGKPFKNAETPLYWYQNQKVWVRFFSKTYLGKTYSNYVPLTVANYHDLAAVMADKEHHLYVDYDPTKLDRYCKVYINDYSSLPDDDPKKGNSLDKLKDLFDLSYGETLEGHTPLTSYIPGLKHLDIILRSDPDYSGKTWTPLGTADGTDPRCFGGMLHGDGHTIKGLSNSLFANLCGDVYNLGVTGSFTTAGLADTGEGYVENCWVKSSATSGFDSATKAVFGAPSGTGTQVVNCYYHEDNPYSETSHARKMTEREFYNGTVAYNLNGFYLNKRYYDKKVPTASDVTTYNYLIPNADGTLPDDMASGKYPNTEPSKYDATNGSLNYVEDRYKDGDFIYAGGEIPETSDVRMRTITLGTTPTTVYAPIWPDDYLYFGQMLTYDYNSSRPHESLPSTIYKNNGRLVKTDMSNRVYRAPAYFRSSDMDVAHFNPWAYIVATSNKDVAATPADVKTVYPNMTAIDFAGHNDALDDSNYKVGLNGKLFFQPLLDDDGLLDFETFGETPNLLVYAPSSTQNSATYNKLTVKFSEPAYADYYLGGDYKRVKKAPAQNIVGHLVQSNLTTDRDHLLVDKKDFNCPIPYDMGSGYRIWYQRLPDNYVDLTKGWESISIPFTAELVSTDQKGEITHFYSGSSTAEGSSAKIGHEYWLRECTGFATTNPATDDMATANFTYPTAIETNDTDDDRIVNNTFLWDYYYSWNGASGQAGPDRNSDIYQTYYKDSRTYKDYPLLTQAKPYLIGFPGTTYYEFDLSGAWTAENTNTTGANEAPVQLEKQTITFVSKVSGTGTDTVTIGVSNTELENNATGPYNGYYFKPNYLNIEVKAPTEATDPNYYVMNDAGNEYTKVESGTKSVSAFRTYFSSGKAVTRGIVFSNNSSRLGGGEEQEPQDNVAESMEFSAKKHKIVVTSHMRSTTDVGIFNVSGLSIGTFSIEPGETIETPVYTSGVYIIRAAGGHYTKKVTVK